MSIGGDYRFNSNPCNYPLIQHLSRAEIFAGFKECLNRYPDLICEVWNERQLVPFLENFGVFGSFQSATLYQYFCMHDTLWPLLLSLFSDNRLQIELNAHVWYLAANEILSFGVTEENTNCSRRRALTQNEKKLLISNQMPSRENVSSEALKFFLQKVNEPSAFQGKELHLPHPPDLFQPFATHPFTLKHFFTGQSEIITRIWKERNFGMELTLAMLTNPDGDGVGILRHFSIFAPIPLLLSLYSDNRLPKMPDNLWYEIANTCFNEHMGKDNKRLLFENAPLPQQVKQEDLKYFYSQYDLEPPQRPAQQGIEKFSQIVNPVLSVSPPSFSLKQAVLPPPPSASVVISPQEQELRELRERMQMMQEKEALAKSRAEQEITALRKQLQEQAKAAPAPADSETECGICFQRMVTIVYPSCGHLACSECQSQMGNTCPFCRQVSDKIIKLFFSNGK